MRYIDIKSEILHGWTYESAHVMGMPDLKGSHCQICGKPATNGHHLTEKGIGGGSKVFMLHGVELESPVISLCGSGTAGCHGLFHAHLYRVEWHWLDMTVECQWWDGSLFRDGLIPKDEILFAFGKYLIFKGDDLLKEICRV